MSRDITWRRAWDSNPRDISAHWVSRPAPSAARTALLAACKTARTILPDLSHENDSRMPLQRREDGDDTVGRDISGDGCRGILHLIGSLPHGDAATGLPGPAQHLDVIATVSDR